LLIKIISLILAILAFILGKHSWRAFWRVRFLILLHLIINKLFMVLLVWHISWILLVFLLFVICLRVIISFYLVGIIIIYLLFRRMSIYEMRTRRSPNWLGLFWLLFLLIIRKILLLVIHHLIISHDIWIISIKVRHILIMVVAFFNQWHLRIVSPLLLERWALDHYSI
jgi:hypothetical protein